MEPFTHVLDARGRQMPPPGWPTTKHAPRRLEDVRQFLNTVNLATSADLLHDRADLQAWLERRGWTAASISVGQLADVHAVRAALRDVATANVQSHAPVGPLAELSVLARRHPVTMGFGDFHRLRPVASDVSGFIADMLQIVFLADIDGRLRRLKACSDTTCRWIVYDASKNGSALWCSGEGCGAKHRSRAFRQRNPAP